MKRKLLSVFCALGITVAAIAFLMQPTFAQDSKGVALVVTHPSYSEADKLMGVPRPYSGFDVDKHLSLEEYEVVQAQLKLHPSTVHYTGTKYFVVIKDTHAPYIWYNQIIGDSLYSGKLNFEKVAANGYVYSGYLDGFLTGDVMGLVDKVRSQR